MKLKEPHPAQPRLRAIAFESAGRRIPQVHAVHMPDEGVLVVVPAEQREIAARLTHRLNLPDILVRAADRLAESGSGTADRIVEHVAVAGVRACTLHGIRGPRRHLGQAVVELLRGNVLERDRRHRLAVAVARAEFMLHAAQPGDRFGGGGAVAVGIGEIQSSRVGDVRRILGVVLLGLAGVIAGVDHHHRHRDAPRAVRGFDRQRERARLEAQRFGRGRCARLVRGLACHSISAQAIRRVHCIRRWSRRGCNRVHAAGEFAIHIILFIGQDAALEVVVAVGHGKGNPRIHNRLQKRLDGSADLAGRFGHELVDARRLIAGEHRRRGMAAVLQTVGHPFG